jgi:hypothetical protein
MACILTCISEGRRRRGDAELSSSQRLYGDSPFTFPRPIFRHKKIMVREATLLPYSDVSNVT